MRNPGASIQVPLAFALLGFVSGQETFDILGTQAPTELATELSFDACDLDTYYSTLQAVYGDPSQWNKESLETVLKDTHRNILPTVGRRVGEDDVYNAIIDLDPGTSNNTVQLIYRNIEMGDVPNANPLYWDVERLWPMQRGYNKFSPAFTDVHQVRPADSTVLLLKGILSFGMCDTVEFEDACVRPANSETANDTAQDAKIWTPPEAFRGEIARALMYMDVRYLQLNLQDCGPFENAMGYKSQMLKWHTDYPATEREIRRNNRACERWQGNRNPFVDYPELATALYGEPEDVAEGTRTYPTCIADFPTPAPTATRNDCGNIDPGDVPVFLVNTDNPDEVVFLPLADIPPDMELFITDQAWNGTHFLEGVENEGTSMMITPEDTGIPQGTLFGFGAEAKHGDLWEVESGTFSLSTDMGDNVFLYCYDADEKIHFLAGYSNHGNWSEAGLSAEEYGEAMSALPIRLVGSAIVLPHYDNYFYNGSRDETIELLRADMLSPNTWVGDDESRFGVRSEEESGASSVAMSCAAVLVMNTLLSMFL